MSAQAPKIVSRNITGPVLYNPITIKYGEVVKTVHLFGDRHQNTEKCLVQDSMTLVKLLKDTLKYYNGVNPDETIDIFAEIGFGSTGIFRFPTKNTDGHIFNTFMEFYQDGCFSRPVDGRCLANFPNTRFHNIDLHLWRFKTPILNLILNISFYNISKL
jgi:hypothetical protein